MEGRPRMAGEKRPDFAVFPVRLTGRRSEGTTALLRRDAFMFLTSSTSPGSGAVPPPAAVAPPGERTGKTGPDDPGRRLGDLLRLDRRREHIILARDHALHRSGL